MSKALKISLLFIFIISIYLCVGYFRVLNYPSYEFDNCLRDCPKGALCDACSPHWNKINYDYSDIGRLNFWKHVLIWPYNVFRLKYNF